MKKRLLQITLFAIIACSCALMSSAHNKLTPNAQLSLLQKHTAQYDSNGKKIKAIDANPVIRLVVEVTRKMQPARLRKSVNVVALCCQNLVIRL